MSKKQAQYRNLARGFTLIEAVTVVAIAAILATSATPSLSHMIDNQLTKSAASDLAISMARARSEAIKRNTAVTVVPKSNGDWATGWIIPDPSYSGSLIEDHGALKNTTVTGPESVSYQSSGRVQDNAAPSFQLSGASSTLPRCVKVDLNGGTQINTGSC